MKGAKGDKGDSVKGDPGSPGADGISPTVAVSKSGKVTTVSITDKNGTKTATINDGADGSPGSAGKDGTSVTVKSVSESTADGGSNVVTFSDGKTLTVKNGSKGSTGATGATGATGEAGKTPVRGTDYWTTEDQAAIVQQVISQLGGNPVFGVVHEDKTITLTANLADGTYTLKYEADDGTVTTIGDIVIGNVGPTYTNQIPISQDADGTVYGVDYNGDGVKDGYKKNTRFSASSNAEKENTGSYLTGWIPVKAGDVIRLLNVPVSTVSGADGNKNAIIFSPSNHSNAWQAYTTTIPTSDNITGQVYDDAGNLTQFTTTNKYAWIRIISSYIGEDSVITKNEEL